MRASNRLLMLGLTLTSYSPKANYCKSNEYNHFSFGSSIKPHPEKEYKGGEDALFADSQLLAVMDGVGGWAEHGIDPALYSKRLAAIIESIWN